MVKGSHLRARLPKVCVDCNGDYLARQANSKRCDGCRKKQEEKGFCKCGCGREVFIKKSGYAYSGCIHRGKKNTGNRARCGFKKGTGNPNYTTKRFQPFKLKNPDSRGRLFRSTLEAQFSDFCYKHDIEFEYEPRLRLNNNKIKVIDFVIDHEIYIEITGYAYMRWQEDFDKKFKILRKTITSPIIVLTYPDKLKKVRDANRDKDVFFDSIDNEEDILKKIRLFQFTNLTNKIISHVENC